MKQISKSLKKQSIIYRAECYDCGSTYEFDDMDGGIKSSYNDCFDEWNHYIACPNCGYESYIHDWKIVSEDWK